MEPARELLKRDPRLVHGLRALGIGRGAVVYAAADLLRVADWNLARDYGAEAVRQVWPEWVYLSLREVIGPEGTLVVPLFSYAYARQHVPFVCEETPSEVGAFSEHIRRKPETVRSLHPLFSLGAIGPAAHAICDNVGRSAYGERSAFGRLREAGTTFVCLGTTLPRSLTYVHHLEHLYGVNHYMHKAFDAPVYRGGQLVPGPWLAFVRYLGCGIEIAVERFEQHLRQKGLLRLYDGQNCALQAVGCGEVHEEGLRCLDADPWFFIRRPVYVRFRQANLQIFDTSVPSALVGYVP